MYGFDSSGTRSSSASSKTQTIGLQVGPESTSRKSESSIFRPGIFFLLAPLPHVLVRVLPGKVADKLVAFGVEIDTGFAVSAFQPRHERLPGLARVSRRLG